MSPCRGVASAVKALGPANAAKGGRFHASLMHGLPRQADLRSDGVRAVDATVVVVIS